RSDRDWSSDVCSSDLLVKELLETYRAQAQGLQAGGGGKFGVDMFVNIVPSNPIRAAASLDMLGIIFFSLVFGAALTMLPEEKTQDRKSTRLNSSHDQI